MTKIRNDRNARSVPMMFRVTGALLAILLFLAWSAHAVEPAKFDPARWETTIQKFEAQDKQAPPAAGGALFIGSSSIRKWDLRKWFPDHADAINRGFGGSHMADSTYYAERIAIPYKPRVIVVYAGDNDIAGGKSPQRVLSDYQAFVKKIHAALPQTKIVYIAIKPSIARWSLVDKMRAANALIRKETESDERLSFIDIDTPMLGGDGKPRPELFVKDGLHLSDAGYKIWSGLVRPYLAEK